MKFKDQLSFTKVIEVNAVHKPLISLQVKVVSLFE